MADPARFIDRLYRTIEGANLDQIAALVSADLVYLDLSQAKPATGRLAYRALMAELFAGLPDFRVHTSTLVVQGDRVAAELVLGGTHLGPFMGYAATGAEIRWASASFYTLNRAHDQLVREVSYHDLGVLDRQMAAQSPLIQAARAK
jgi:steroid delta-isomerase-like uncharacterized protein